MSQKNISIPATLYDGADPNVLLFSQNLRNILVQFVGQTNANVSFANNNYVVDIDGTAPITATSALTSIGKTFTIAMPAATNSVDGYMTSSDHALLPSAGQKDALAGTSGTPSASNKYVTNADSRNSDARTTLCAGTFDVPAYTDNGNGTITLGAGVVTLNSQTDGKGLNTKYSFAGATYDLTDNTINYIIANYNSGTPAIQVTTIRASINWYSIVPIYTIYREGNILHILDWDSASACLAEKLLHRITNNYRFERDNTIGGLMLGEAATRLVTMTAGVVWYGVNNKALTAFNSSTDELLFYYHSGGNWASSAITQYINSQYDDGTNLQTLGSNKYVVNWIFRGVEDAKESYLVLGKQYTTATAASEEAMPTLPSVISSHCIFVGRIIVNEGDATAYAILSAFNTLTPLGSSSTSDHNSLTGLQGGTAGEYYHLTSAQYTAATQSWGTLQKTLATHGSF